MTLSARFQVVERAFTRDAEATGSNVWTDVVRTLRRNALQSNLSAEEYREFLFRASRVLQTLAGATGRLQEDSWSGKILEVRDFWRHATYRNLLGVDLIELDAHKLVSAFSGYQKLPMQTPYLDWVFLDAYLYHVCFALKRDYDEGRFGSWDTGALLPRVESMIAQSSDAARAHPLLLELGLRIMRGALRLAPTMIVVAIGVALLFFDWEKTGSAILVAWLLYRIARLLRWMLRTPSRRRARSTLAKLKSAYGLLEGEIIPTRQMRATVHEALQIYGERLVFGVAFWAILDDVCERYPSVLNLGSD